MVHEKVSMGLDWYIKWFASIVLIIGAAVTALDMYPYNMYFQFVGLTGWLIVGIMWKDWPLIVVNTVCSFILFAGIIHYLTTKWYLTIYSNYIEVLL